MARNLVCGECSGKMHLGFVFDRGHGNEQLLPRWVEGQPQRSLWGWGPLKISGRNIYYSVAYRCERCGLLKFYAGPDHPVER